MERVLDLISAKTPSVLNIFFTERWALTPKHLVTWYIFSKDKDLEEAKQNGLTKEISERRERNYFTEVILLKYCKKSLSILPPKKTFK